MGAYRMNPKVKIWIRLVLMVVFFAVVIIGHQMIGKPGVATMLVGLAGLLVLLWDYNRPYSKS